MRKQAKLVAVLSAAALLAVGASMTSFAATPHWDMEDGEWVYLDRNGDKVTDVWKKSNGQWYYLDEDGFMAKDRVIEDDDDKFYVGEDGARVANAWVSMDNDDLLDDDDEIDSIETVWMYFSSNGKALGSGNDHGEIKKLSYGDGQSGYFIFNEDGYMLSGWKTWTKDGDDDELYYLGDQNEGWARTGWNYLPVDPDLEAFSGISEADEEYNEEEWFYFNGNGKAVLDDTKSIGGKTYIFDQWGRMLDLWVYARGTNADSDYTNEKGSSATWATRSDETATKSAAFYREDNGGRDKNWILAYPKTAYDDYSDDEYWFYLDSNGRPFRAVNPTKVDGYDGKSPEKDPGTAVRIDNDERRLTEVDNNVYVAAKSIKNSTYLFNDQGVMLTVLYWLGDDTAGIPEDHMEDFDTYRGDSPVYRGSSETPMRAGYYYFTEDGKLVTNYGDGATYQIVSLSEVGNWILTSDEGWVFGLTDKNGKVLMSQKRSDGNVRLLINENGKIKQSDSTTDVNDQRVTVSGYEVTKVENKD